MITYNHTNQRMMAMLALLLVFGTLLAPAGRAQGNYSFQLINSSSYTIDKVYFSPTYTDQWGSDQLGNGYLVPGFTFTMWRYGSYDLKLVDQDGDVCIVRNLNIYQNLYIQITDPWLLACEARSR